MKNKPILIVAGEPNSVFFEILFKSYSIYRIKSPVIIIASQTLLNKQIKKFKFKKKIRLIDYHNLKKYRLDNSKLNLINIKSNLEKKNKKQYIKDSFDVAFKIIKNGFTNKLINGPIEKSEFLEKKFLGVTEYISKSFKKKKICDVNL